MNSSAKPTFKKPDETNGASMPNHNSHKVKRRMLHHLSASAVSQVIDIVSRVITVPLFLRAWGIEFYGEWILLTSVLQYISMGDFGFPDVIGTEMTLEATAGKKERAAILFQSMSHYLIRIYLGTFLLATLAYWTLPISSWVRATHFSAFEAPLILTLMTVSTLLGLTLRLPMTIYRAAQEFPKRQHIFNAMLFSDSFVLGSLLLLKASPTVLALSLILPRSLISLFVWRDVRKKHPWAFFPHTRMSWKAMSPHFRPALSYQVAPLIHAINNQGFLLLIARAFGPVAAAAFSVYRTVARIASAPGGFFASVIQPEMSCAFGEKNFGLVRKLFVQSLRINFWTSLVLVLTLTLMGNTLIFLWTRGHIPFIYWLYYPLLLACMSNAIGVTSMSTLCSVNKHSRLIITQLFIITLALLIPFLLPIQISHYSISFSLLLGELAMGAIAIRKAIVLLNEGKRKIFREVLTPPTRSELRGLYQHVQDFVLK